MYRYGKTTQSAIAAMSRLVEVYDGGKTSLSSLDIADNRRLSKALVAKLLSILSVRGLIRGYPGPGGGYVLAKAPDQITLMDVVRVFEQPGEATMCPFGPGWCGTGKPCPLHDTLVRLDEGTIRFLEQTTLAVFQGAGKAPAPSTKPKRRSKSRPR